MMMIAAKIVYLNQLRKVEISSYQIKKVNLNLSQKVKVNNIRRLNYRKLYLLINHQYSYN